MRLSTYADTAFPRPRQESPPPSKDSNRGSKVAIVVVVVSAIIFSAVLLIYLALKALRVRHSTPKYIPTQFLKRRWERWHPRGLTASRGVYSARLQDENEGLEPPTLHPRGVRSAQVSTQNLAQEIEHAETEQVSNHDRPGRQTSVRSVITLPKYSRSVRESERVLGREGERDGIDVVVEAPETVDEEETRREEEMQSLYEIRQQRRIEIEERNNRRERRRDARARGDVAELARIQEESRLATQRRGHSGAAVMILEHQSRSRERRVSSVSYAELGVARHDGSRVRANSNESDRPLLDSAASMSGVSMRPYSTTDSLSVHQRARSTSSMSDISDQEFPPYGRAGSDYEVVSMTQMHSRNNSRGGVPTRSRASSAALSVATADISDEPIPAVDPPSYDDGSFEEAPPYTSPSLERAPSQIRSQVRTQSQSPPQLQLQPQPQPQPNGSRSRTEVPRLPDISRLPSIRIADATPIEPRAPMDFPLPERGRAT